MDKEPTLEVEDLAPRAVPSPPVGQAIAPLEEAVGAGREELNVEKRETATVRKRGGGGETGGGVVCPRPHADNHGGALTERRVDRKEAAWSDLAKPMKARSGPSEAASAVVREREVRDKRKRREKRLLYTEEEKSGTNDAEALERKRTKRQERKKKKERRRSKRFASSSSSVLGGAEEEGGKRRSRASKCERSKSTPAVDISNLSHITRTASGPQHCSPPVLSSSAVGKSNSPDGISPKRKQNSTRQKRNTPAPMTFRHFHDFILAADAEDSLPAGPDSIVTRAMSMEQLQVTSKSLVPDRSGTVTPPRSVRDTGEERSSSVPKRGSALMSTDVNERKSIYEIPSLKAVYTPLSALHKGNYSKHFQLMNSPSDKACATTCVPRQGTLVDIVEWASFFPRHPFVMYLLLCFRTLYSPEDLLKAVIAVTKKHEEPDDDTELLDRVYLFIAQWLLLWGAEDITSSLRSELLGFVQSLFCPTMRRASNHIKLIVLQGTPPGTKLGTFPFVPEEVVEAARRRKGRRRISAKEKKLRSRSNRIMTSIMGNGPPDMWKLAPERLAYEGPDLLQFPNSVIAQQLTLMHLHPFHDVGLLEFLGCRWQKADKSNLAPNLTKVSNDFNKLSLWVATTIVTAEQPKRQSQLYKKFIRLAQNLLDVRNYSCCVAVISGLNNIAVTRLEHIRAGVSEKYLSILSRVDNVVNPAENYKEYRRLPRTFPYVPFMPVHLRDISVIHETMQDFVDEEKTVINFEKFHSLGEAIYSIGIEQTGATDFDFEPDEMLQSLITAMIQRNLDEDALYSRSVNAKPVRVATGTKRAAPDVPLLIEDSKSLSPEMFNGKYHMVKKEVDGLRGKSLFTLMLSEEGPPGMPQP